MFTHVIAHKTWGHCYITVRMKHFTFMVISSIVFTLVLNAKFRWVEFASVNTVGLLLYYVTELTSQAGTLTWYSTRIYSGMSSVERILEYSQDTEMQEESWEDPSPPKGWPQHGGIEVNNFWVRYREDLEPVLKGISFKINPGEKVGLVGRTGSGKSTLFLSLLRILEKFDKPGSPEGFITIDGVRIDKIGLHHLRKNVCIIPQDPFVMEGTLKFNLDPLNEYTVEQVESVLSEVGFFETLNTNHHVESTSEPVLQKNLPELGQPLIEASEINTDSKFKC